MIAVLPPPGSAPGFIERDAALCCTMSVVCTCPRDQLCDGCLRQSLMWLGGVAASRGHRWAESAAQRRPDLLALPWPVLEGRAAELAAHKVIDLSQDKRLFGELLRELDETARRRWDQLRTARR